jgi:hypothetical protein
MDPPVLAERGAPDHIPDPSNLRHVAPKGNPQNPDPAPRRFDPDA